MRRAARARSTLRQQLGEDPRALRFLEARMQRGELDRDARRAALTAPIALRIELEIARRVLGGARRFAEHVEGEAVGPALAAALHRVLDGLGEHELAGEDAHRLAHRGAHHRLAEARDEPLELRRQVSSSASCQRASVPVSISAQSAALAAAPVRPLGELVAEQRVGGLGVRECAAAPRPRTSAPRLRAWTGRSWRRNDSARQRRGRRGAHALARAAGRVAAIRSRSRRVGLQRPQALDRLGFGDAMVRGECASVACVPYNAARKSYAVMTMPPRCSGSRASARSRRRRSRSSRASWCASTGSTSTATPTSTAGRSTTRRSSGPRCGTSAA